jgi:glycosyltransferase involved in cell wall biosynthesis
MDLRQYSRTTRWTVGALRWLSRLPAGVATNSHAGRLAHERLGYRPKRWFYLPNGVETATWHPDAVDRASIRRDLAVAGDAVLVGTVARVDPMKDHASLLSAAERVAAADPRAVFVLVGAGTESLAVPEALAGRVRRLGVRDDIARIMRGLDIHLLTSAFGEGFPNVVAEAMASGTPCVVTDVGDAAEIVGETGRVVRPADPAGMAEAVLGLVRLSRAERTALGAKARERIVERWSIERAIVEYEGVIAEVGAVGRKPLR